MLLSDRQLQTSVDWLLAHGSPPVMYLTRRDLLRDDPSSEAMKGLWSAVEKCEEAIEIFAKQQPDGSWCAGGSWAAPPSYMPKQGYSPVSPKYVTTAWVLPILGDMGFTIGNERVRKACEYILSFQYRNGFIGECADVDRHDMRQENPCRFAVAMIGFGKAGMGRDPRTLRAYDLLVRSQRDDGGWVFEEHRRKRNWTRSCPWATYHTTMALYCAKNGAYAEVLSRALSFLIWHLSTKDDDEIRRFFYHGHSTVHELVMLSELNIGLDERPVQAILDWLMTMYCPSDGCFRYRGKPISRYSRHGDHMDARVARYRLYHLIEDDWLTYYATRIAANMAGHYGAP